LVLARFANNLLFSILLIIVVLVVFYSRIHVKDHDHKDVIGGFIAGLIAGMIVLILNSAMF
jgi:RsiW-degrading membrane proteinase PrsW (M82 family)